ncbi:hypothetical protein [Bradyrhizobium sp. SZCCHNRI2010]|uniref:hypothetical protein n=1 Tax=Bradyrhizobium sp. SZCCHNRI2010 TaxID=3057283 RepID=UPI0028E80420|nr:hypothetical protein [Bradyrhizobium sp. SZCCHNRI2010]
MSFYLVRLEPDPDQPGVCTDVPLPDYGPYEKGSEAAKEAKRVGDLIGCRVQPRRMSQAGEWRERHRKALESGIELGTLKRLPEKWDLPQITDHFAHLDPIHYPGMISFVASEEEGILDRYTRLTPGRYISRYYADHDIEDDKRRKLIATIDPSGELLFATTPDEIENVYKEGPDSCMDGDHEFNTPVWPTSVYGAGDLAVAYTMNNRGRIQSRAVCWPAKKIYGRCYGDVQRIEKALEDEGFETTRDDHSVDGNGPTFVGARIMKVLMLDENYAVMPYFDDLKYCIDAGDHWITVDERPGLDDTEHPDVCGSGGTNGYTKIQRWCQKEQYYHDKSGFALVHGVDEQWSLMAREKWAFRCAETKEWWPNEAKYRVVIPGIGPFDGPRNVSKKWFDEHGAICAKTKKACRKSDLVEHEGEMVSREWLKAEERRKRRAEDWRGSYAGMKADNFFIDEADIYKTIPLDPVDPITSFNLVTAVDHARLERHVRDSMRRTHEITLRDLMEARMTENLPDTLLPPVRGTRSRVA